MKTNVWKKTMAMMLTLSMAGAAIGCGGSKTETTAAAAETTAAETTEASSSEEASAESSEESESGTVEGALAGVTLSFGTSGLFAPFSYYDEDGTTLIGFDLDFEKALEEYLGFTLSEDPQAMDYSALTTSLATSKLDFGMAALCATDERKAVMNFTETYCDSGQVLCINIETSPAELTSVDLLASGDFTVAVEKGTASHLYCQNIGVPESCMEVHDAITTAYESLEQGKVDCLLQDGPGMAYYIKTVEGTKLQIVGEEFNQGQAPYAIAISNDCAEANPGIVDIFSQAIAELMENGTFAELQAKWLQ